MKETKTSILILFILCTQKLYSEPIIQKKFADDLIIQPIQKTEVYANYSHFIHLGNVFRISLFYNETNDRINRRLIG